MERAAPRGGAAAAGCPGARGRGHGRGRRPSTRTGWWVERLEVRDHPTRKILRDAQWAGARYALTAQCAGALAAIHTIDLRGRSTALKSVDPLGDPLAVLDALGEARPALELGVRWLERHRPAAGPRVTVHGDFRLGNFLVGPDGLRGVLDWELAHAGDAAEDIGWLCAPAWRFGGSERGIGRLRLPGGAARVVRAACMPAATIMAQRPGALVAGACHGQVGRHLLAAGVGPPERVRRDRRSSPPSGGRSARASGTSSRSRSVWRRATPPPRQWARAARWPPSGGRRQPSWSRPCASTSRPT